ncbi:HEAT repeat domain-containing protein [Streptomyces sp. NPDC003877]
MRTYPSVTHAYWALSTADPAARAAARDAERASAARHAAAGAPRREGWDQARTAVMTALLRAEYTQHPALARVLLDTADATLVHDDVDSGHWGDNGGRGRNRTGRLLELVRSELLSRQAGIAPLSWSGGPLGPCRLSGARATIPWLGGLPHWEVAMGADHQIAFFLRESAAPEPERRAAALKGLGRRGGAEHVPVFTEAAADPAPQVRAAAARALGRLGIPEAGHEVLPRLMEDADPGVRRRACVSVTRLGLHGPTVAEAFGRLLCDPDRQVRILALEGLAALGVPGDPAALTALLGDPDSAVWGRARTLLHSHRDDEAVRTEVIRTARGGTGAARARVLEWLPRQCTEPLLDSLLTGLHDPHPDVRLQAARRLFHVEQRQVQDSLEEALRTERDPRVAAALLDGSGGRADGRPGEPAVRWLRDPVAGPSAARLLGTLDTASAATHLRAALDDKTLPALTRAACARAIGAGGRWDAVWLLLPLLDDPDADLRAGVLDGLEHLVENGLRPWERHPVAWVLSAHLESDARHVWRTRNALWGLTQALPALRRLTDGAGSGEVRAAALSLLDGDDEADEHTRHDVRRFLRGLDDPHEPVRYEAVCGLRRWADAHGSWPPGAEHARDRLTALTADAGLLAVLDAGPGTAASGPA